MSDITGDPTHICPECGLMLKYCTCNDDWCEGCGVQLYETENGYCAYCLQEMLEDDL